MKTITIRLPDVEAAIVRCQSDWWAHCIV